MLGVLPGIVGSLQAVEAIKLILDLGDPLIGRLLTYDSLEQSFREYKVQVDPTNEITYANRDRIVVAELDDLCMPHPLQAPATHSSPPRHSARARGRCPSRCDGRRTPPRSRGRRSARISSVIGLVIGVVAAASWSRPSGRSGTGCATPWPTPRPGSSCSAFAAGGMTTIAAGWTDVLELLGAHVGRWRVIGWYYVGELGKYLPGGVWPVLGRGELARTRRGGPQRRLRQRGPVLATLYLAAALTALVFCRSAWPVVATSARRCCCSCCCRSVCSCCTRRSSSRSSPSPGGPPGATS